MIRSGPIDFGKKKKSLEDPEGGSNGIKVAAAADETSARVEVISKKESPGQLLNNFDKLKEADGGREGTQAWLLLLLLNFERLNRL